MSHLDFVKPALSAIRFPVSAPADRGLRTADCNLDFVKPALSAIRFPVSAPADRGLRTADRRTPEACE